MVSITRPAGMFDRDREWAALCRFASDPTPGATLGVVTGRRRQGKTLLLQALVQATGGFYFAADEATDAESLRRIGVALGTHLGSPVPLALTDWHQAFDVLLSLGRERQMPIVIDEFPYLVASNPSLPSILQNALAPLRNEREESRSRILLCGSALSVMGNLLTGSAPLRGRASLELVVPTLNFQLAAEFWNQPDPTSAIKVHAVVGGTPAYRREFARDDVPASPDDFNAWVCRTVLSPTSPLFREARYLLADEPGMRDVSIYHSVLAAIAAGNTTRSRIASYMGRKSGDLAHPLTVLEDAGLVLPEADAFRKNRTSYRITEPLLAFHHAMMRPIWADLERVDDPSELWQRASNRFASNILGPHFEHLTREWLRYFAPKDFFKDRVSLVRSGVVNDPSARTTHELDLAAFSIDDDGASTVLAIGEAKWGDVIGQAHLDRLRHIRGLLTTAGHRGAVSAQLVLASASGFTDSLIKQAATSSEIVLVGAADLYRRQSS